MSDTKKYYDALKNEEYKALLDSEVQASIAKEQALKYMNNSVNAQGFGNQGVAESTKAGVYSQYSNALHNANNTYRKSINQINEQERQALDAERDEEFQTLTSLMNNATNQNELNDIIGKYGVSIGEDGAFVYGENSNLSDKDRKQLEIIYSLMNKQLENANYAGREASLSGDMVVYNADGTYAGNNYNAENNFSGETRTVKNSIATGALPNDSYVHIESQHGGHIYLYYLNGQLYYVTPDEYKAHKGDNAYYVYGWDNMKKDKN